MGVGLDPVSGKSDLAQTIRRQWSFLAGLVTTTFRMLNGAATGKLLKSDASGNATWGDPSYATATEPAGGTASETGTLIGASSGAIGEYLITGYIEVTTASAAGTVDLQVTFTDEIGSNSVTVVIAVALTGTNRGRGSAVIRTADGGVDYSFNIAALVGVPVWQGFVHATKLR